MNRKRCSMKTNKGLRCKGKKYYPFSMCYIHLNCKKLKIQYMYLVYQILTKKTYNRNLFTIICSYLRRIPEYNLNIFYKDKIFLQKNFYKDDSIYYIKKAITKNTYIIPYTINLVNDEGEIVNENLLLNETSLKHFDNLYIL